MLEILQRDSLQLGGFAGLTEHRLVADPRVFGSDENTTGSWQGIGNFVYLADARFMPHGDTRMHDHREIDVISIILEGRIVHQGSLQQGQSLEVNDVQVQRAGGDGFSHNEINPDDKENRLIQIWVLPETPGGSAEYRHYKPKRGELVPIYGSHSHSHSQTYSSSQASRKELEQQGIIVASTNIDIALLSSTQAVALARPFMAYLARGTGLANNVNVKEGDLFLDTKLHFKANDDSLLILIFEDK